MDGNFEKYVNMIRSRAWEYSKASGIDYSELESQGYLIYCECLEKYDITKSGFSTYLYIQLNRLGDFVRTYKRQKGVCIQDYFGKDVQDSELNLEEEIESCEEGLSLSSFLSEAKEFLSQDAFEIIEWIVLRSWERKNKRTPTISMAVKHFNKSKEIIETAWNECSNFWNSKGFLMYC